MNKSVGRSSLALDAQGDDNFKLTLFPDAGGCVEADVSLREVQTAIKAHLDKLIPIADITRLIEKLRVLPAAAAHIREAGASVAHGQTGSRGPGPCPTGSLGALGTRSK